MKKLMFIILVLCEFIKKCFSYNETIPFNWTQNPNYCYVEDFLLTHHYRPYQKDIEVYPIRGCNSTQRNLNYAIENGINNITFYPKLDFFMPKEEYPPLDPDPPSYITFKIRFQCTYFQRMFTNEYEYYYRIYFGRSEDYLPIPKISKRTGKPIEFIGKKAILKAKLKYFKNDIQSGRKISVKITSKDFDFYDYEGIDLNVTFDGYELDFQFDKQLNFTKLRSADKNFCPTQSTFFALLIRVYDIPRMKVQGLFQYRGILFKKIDNSIYYTNNYTVDTRNIFSKYKYVL